MYRSFFGVAHTPHVPLNAFINASPWPNSQHLFPIIIPFALSLSLFYSSTNSGCHLHAYIILHTWCIVGSRKLCSCLGLLMAYDVAFGFCFFCLCLCLPECQCRKTKAMSDNDNDSGNGNNKSVTMIIKETGRWPCCQVVKHSGTRHERRNQPIIKTNAHNLHRTHN